MNLEYIFSNLVSDVKHMHEWFAYNSMKASSDQFQYIVLGNICTLQIDDITINQLHL